MSNGCNRQALGFCSEAEGCDTQAIGGCSHAEGGLTQAGGIFSHTEGLQTTASGNASHTEGILTTASGVTAHAQGFGCTASGDLAHAEGNNTTASGESSHSEGRETNAFGDNSHAEGFSTTTGDGLDPSKGMNAHAEGFSTTATGFASHAEGQLTTASGGPSHAEGQLTTASGFVSHAEGNRTTASAIASHAEGDSTTAGFPNSHIMGRFGDADEAHSWFIANGTFDQNRGLGAKWSASTGNMSIDGLMYIAGGADYAEMFETVDGNPIDVGYFVTAAKEDKIRKATATDDFILGIVSATPSFLGNSADLRWQGKYLLDQWGRKKYHEVVIPAQKDQQGNIIIPEQIEIQPMLNPKWNANEEYISRTKRSEWVAVGLIGQVLVRDDGTCETHGYCKPNDDGIAAKAEKGYFVLKRTGPNQILILLR